jgi:hypothetical protein
MSYSTSCPPTPAAPAVSPQPSDALPLIALLIFLASMSLLMALWRLTQPEEAGAGAAGGRTRKKYRFRWYRQ